MRVVLEIDPLPAIKETAKTGVTEQFNIQAHQSLHLDQAHTNKRQIAVNVASDPARATSEFQEEAALRGISVTALASLILSKPNNAAIRELDRQKIMLKIELAKSPSEIAEILKG